MGTWTHRNTNTLLLAFAVLHAGWCGHLHTDTDCYAHCNRNRDKDAYSDRNIHSGGDIEHLAEQEIF